ncbi:hypothetical protein HELRODRAFT_177839 [Helobdella robusta]|uniref:SOCS box domain-containing protein n=1 Tax=Helobdella robusta TaxID=6412 RepID=T1FCC7_HELRO|nr:hypothetical protein HELRODRAFT_177839 [Helobdella robusta]ESN97776.1 hypothetical protein HELRODRAFT_177839 [Helobdella robusta]
MEKFIEDLVYHNEYDEKTLQTKLSLHRLDQYFEPDKFILNILHHAILAKNLKLIYELLVQLNENPAPCLKTKLPYLHLAAIIGCPEVAKQLCRFFLANEEVEDNIWWASIKHCLENEDFIAFITGITSNDFFSVLKSKFELLLKEMTRLDLKHKSTAIDVAAICKSEEVLKIYLHTTPLLKKPSSSFTLFDRAIEFNSPRAFSYLTETSSTLTLSSAFINAIRQLRLDVVERLMSCDKLNITEALGMSNPFHIACMMTRITSDRPNTRYLGLDDLFAFFIKQDFDVNSKSAPGHFPLYSLLYSLVHEKDVNSRGVPEYHIRALTLLLEAGADPNFDETTLSNKKITFNSSSLICLSPRDLYISALDAYFSCLQTCDTWSNHVMEHLDQVCLLLLEHNADATKMLLNNETPLHLLVRLAANQHCMGHLSADFFLMMRMLMYFGANPDARTLASISYPVHYYFSHIFHIMGGTIAYDRWINSGAIQQVVGILTYMDRDEANTAVKMIGDDMVRTVKENDGLTEEFVEKINHTLLDYVRNVMSLQDICKMTLWRATGRKVNRLKGLRLPRRLFSEIKSFFAVDV